VHRSTGAEPGDNTKHEVLICNLSTNEHSNEFTASKASFSSGLESKATYKYYSVLNVISLMTLNASSTIKSTSIDDLIYETLVEAS
jgi:hypothetical protein